MKTTILLIDDSPTDRILAEFAARDLDAEIIAVGTLEEALNYLDSGGAPHVLVSDYYLGGDGLESVVPEASKRKIPVVVLSGSDSPKHRESARAIGVLDWLPKPMRNPDLTKTLQTIVSRFGGRPALEAS